MPQYRLGGEITLQEMGSRALVLIGAFSNPWVMQLNSSLTVPVHARPLFDPRFAVTRAGVAITAYRARQADSMGPWIMRW